MGEDSTDGDFDAFAQLSDPNFVSGATVREPSAEERARNAERVARQADLRRRIAEESADDYHLTAAGGRPARRSRFTLPKFRTKQFRAGNRHVNVRYALAAVVGFGVVGAIMWSNSRQPGFDAVAAARPSNIPPVDESASPEPLGEPPPAPDPAGPFEFAITQDDDVTPVAWDPCRTVRYVVNDTNAPAGTAPLIAEAIARTAAATGLTFVDEGATDETWSKNREPYQPDRYGEQWAPALIAWAPESEVPGLGGYVAGLGGGSSMSDPSGDSAYVSGQVVLDSADLGAIMATPGGPDAVRSVIQHELGHMVGLDHVADPTQLMNTEGNEAQAADWGAGDLAGLHQLGSGKCFPQL